MIETLVVIAKEPVAGRVKTRLIGAVTAEQAAALAACAIADTIEAVADYPANRRVILLDGTPGDWLPAGWQVIEQSAGDLDERLSSGFDGLPPGPAVLVGMDTPQLQAFQLQFDPSRYDACLGMATDGGFWAIGFADPTRARSCISGVPMSQAETGAVQLGRLIAAGLRVQLLPTLTDVDTAETAQIVAGIAPDTAFARLWNEIVA